MIGRGYLFEPQPLKPPEFFHHLHRLLRVLTHFGIRVLARAGSEPVHDLTPMSRLVTNKEVSFNLLPYVRFHLEDFLLKPSLYIGDWFMKKDKEMPFEMAHGFHFWEIKSQNPELNKMFNDALASGSCFFTDVIGGEGIDLSMVVWSVYVK
jgi:hypothetical protein